MYTKSPVSKLTMSLVSTASKDEDWGALGPAVRALAIGGSTILWRKVRRQNTAAILRERFFRYM